MITVEHIVIKKINCLIGDNKPTENITKRLYVLGSNLVLY